MATGVARSPAEKLLVLHDAVFTSAATAATKWGVPEPTIWGWAQEVGGLTALRELYEVRTQAALMEAKTTITNELQRRISAMPDDDLTAIVIQMLKGEGAKGAGGTSIEINAGASATAASAVVAEGQPQGAERTLAILKEMKELGLFEEAVRADAAMREKESVIIEGEFTASNGNGNHAAPEE